MRPLRLIAAGSFILGIGIGFAPYTMGAFLGCFALGLLMVATGVFYPEGVR